MKPIPVYVVTGFLGNGKTTFINSILPTRPAGAAVVQIERGRCTAACSEILSLPPVTAENAKGTAFLLEQFGRERRPSEVWIEWNGMSPFAALEKIFSRKAVREMYDLKEILFVATPRFCLHMLGATGEAVYGQLVQADRFIMTGHDKGEYKKAVQLIRAVRPDIPVTPLQEAVSGKMSKVIAKRPLHIGATAVTIGLVLLAAVYAFIITDGDPATGNWRLALSFWTATLLQALPFLVVGIVAASLLQLVLSPAFLERSLRKNHFTGTAAALVGAFLFPVCDCAAVPVFRSLVAARVPVSTALAFMLAGPLINPVVLVSTYVAFAGNMEIFLWRTVGGIAAVLFISLTFFAYTDLDGISGGKIPLFPGDTLDGGNTNNVIRLILHGRREFLRMAPYVLAGTFLSSLFQVYGSTLLQDFGIWPSAILMIPLMLLIAFFLSVCSTADAMVARNFSAHIPTAGIIAFLLFGPMMDLKNFLLLRALFPKAFVYRLAATTFCICAFIAAMYALMTGGGLR